LSELPSFDAYTLVSNEPSAIEIERELDALVNSRTFGKSVTLQRLLDFLVRNALAENSINMSESAIATSVLNRHRDFSPVEDSIVRKTMARLRDKLMDYYAGEGRGAEMRILLERGSYRPAFLRKEELHEAWPPVRSPRVLLLPFNPVNFHDSDYFADGLLEDLMIALAGGSGIPLVPWTTARYLREKTGDMREYRRVTGADVILDGTVRRLSDSLLQVTLSWVDGLTTVFDTYLQVRTDPNQTGEAINTLCEQISERLGSDFSEEIHKQIGPRHCMNAEARSLYLRAQRANRMGTAEGTRTAFAYLRRALELQPDYAAAHALMADGHIYAGISGIASPRAEMPLATECAQRALTWAPRLASALAAKGGVQFAYQWDFAGARRSLNSARSLDPTSDSAHFWSEAVMAATDDPALAALRMEERAEADNCSAATAYLAASYSYNAHNWRRCEFWARRAIELDPAYFRPYPFLAGACLELQKPEEAQMFAESARRLSGPNPYTSGMLGIVLARTGRKSEARTVLNDHIESMKSYSSSMGKAVICSALGDREQACDAIEKMIEDREPYVAWLHIFPFFGGLHEEERFRRLLESRTKPGIV
jgi:TolB-like protein/tetratricopeptide (TPR) repeat protein